MPQKMKQENRCTVGASNTQIPTMDSSAGENLAKLNPVKDYVIYDDKVYYIHHIYDRFAASKDGSIFNLQTKQIGIGYIENKSGCYRFTAFTKEYIEKGKCYYNHRFIWEAINKQSLSKNVIIRHIDGNKQNNCIDNLELMTRSENAKHANEAKKYKTKIVITTDKPIESIKMDIELEESDDEFTENEKQKIDKKFNSMMKKIENGNFPYKKQLKKHLPNIEFW